jgi:hypothetical protein
MEQHPTGVAICLVGLRSLLFALLTTSRSSWKRLGLPRRLKSWNLGKIVEGRATALESDQNVLDSARRLLILFAERANRPRAAG